MAGRVTDTGDDTPDTGDAPKRRRLPSSERRQDFIVKAIEFFAEEGFESSTRGLAKKLGVTQPLLYRYFPSKDDLISEVYDEVYVNRWRPEWADLLSDRSVPLEDRLNRFYGVYTDVIFNREWMRIYLFSGLKGVDINRRYMQLVRTRILEPILAEVRADASLPEATPTEEEIEFAWTIHGGIFYYGVRVLIYESAVSLDKDTVIRDAIEALLSGIRAKMTRDITRDGP